MINKARDRQTGQYKHTWEYSSEQPIANREFATCATCEKITVIGGNLPDRLYKNFETAVRKETKHD